MRRWLAAAQGGWVSVWGTMALVISSGFDAVVLGQDTNPASLEWPAVQAETTTQESDPPNEPGHVATDEHSDTADPLPGHSFHGEVFNEGPRQAAYLMEGTGEVRFPVSTDVEEAQQFFNQGIGQLHGFWYFEAERSFRQAAALDNDCAMFYWGMAMANLKNPNRALKFIAEAKTRWEAASPREKMWIDAVEKFCTTQDAEGKAIPGDKRAQQYTRDLEEILFLEPTDIEVKAFLVGHLWENQRGQLATVSHVAVDALLEQVFAVSPLHPAHHYRIHLWDQRDPKQALTSAALCGPSGPGIAHMWHMPGHIYSGLHRYPDAVWQMEASARVDHHHMIRDQVLPDQIHNYAHNNEWLIRNLLKVGRAHQAVALAENMLALPRHPRFNHEDSGSGRYGRQRAIAALSSYRMWDELVRRADWIFGPSPAQPARQWEKWQQVGMAAALTHSPELVADMRQQLSDALEQKKEEQRAEKSAETPKPDQPVDDPQADQGQAEQGQSEQGPGDGDRAEGQASEESKADQARTDAATPVANGTDPIAQSDAKPTQNSGVSGSEKAAPVANEDLSLTAPKPEVAPDEPSATRPRNSSRRRQESPLDRDISTLQKAIAGLDAAVAAGQGQWDEAVRLADQASGVDSLLKAEWQALAGKFSEAHASVRQERERRPADVVPAAVSVHLTHLHWRSVSARDSDTEVAPASESQAEATATAGSSPEQTGDPSKPEAVDADALRLRLREEFDELRRLATDADLDTPLLARLREAAETLDYPADWRLPRDTPADLGPRPALDSLGPLHWSPYRAPHLVVRDATGLEVLPLADRQEAKLVMFYLGFGCLHCMEQLQKFSPEAERFAELGIELMAVSCESLELLQQGLENYDQPLQFPLFVDADMAAFRAFRCYDDFENQPLHGTFLIAPDGRVLWQDIGHEPFMDVDFLHRESKRLLETWSARPPLLTTATVPN